MGVVDSQRILGIDPGLATIGFGCIELIQGHLQVVEYGIIPTPPKTPITTRLQVLYEDLTTLIQQLHPHRIGIEKLFFYKMGNTIPVAQARGVILLVLGQQHLVPEEFTPAQVKQNVAGHGNADKRAVQESVAKELALGSIPKPDDAADALAIALTTWYANPEIRSIR